MYHGLAVLDFIGILRTPTLSSAMVWAALWREGHDENCAGSIPFHPCTSLETLKIKIAEALGSPRAARIKELCLLSIYVGKRWRCCPR